MLHGVKNSLKNMDYNEMHSLHSGINRTIAMLNEQELNRVFPGVPPNTQIRIVGPVGLSSELGENQGLDEEYNEIEAFESPFITHSDNQIEDHQIENSSSRRLNNSARETIEENKISNLFVPAERSSSWSFTESEFLEHITSLMEKIITSDIKMWGNSPDMHVTGFGPGQSLKQLTMKNIIFEVNRLVINSVIINQLNPAQKNNNDKFSASISYVRNSKQFYTGPSWIIKHSGKTINEAITKVYENLKAMNRCTWCDAIWDTRMSKECITCLISDFFTRGNEEIECPACKEKIKDFTTLECRHRICYKCVFKLIVPRKCPLCRYEIDV